jgi:hypothetical protein
MSFLSRRRGGQSVAAPAVRRSSSVIESLEDRKLLSAVSLSRGGTLFVEGTRHNDEVVVHRNPANRRELEVVHDGQSEIIAGRVKRVVVVTGAGDDSVTLDRRVSVSSTLQGGDGDDSLSGGSGDDSLEGDAGDDSLVGGAGNDDMHGGDGTDDMEGDDGDDSIHGENGRDHVRGDHGDDSFDNNKEVEEGDNREDDQGHDLTDDHGGDTGGNGTDDGTTHDQTDDNGELRAQLA